MLLHKLDEVVGQQSLIAWLSSMLNQDKVPHVLMLVGQPGIGKTSIAKIIACEIAYKDRPDKLNEAKEKVIDKNGNTSAVSLYNMSNLKSQDAVLEVRNDLTVGLSSTKRKVVIMDEAHGMSEAAQDSLLVKFEALENDVWVIICSTDITSFREAFVSRCIVRNLQLPSQREIKTLLSSEIKTAGLKFSIPMNMAQAFILSNCGYEPRRISNFIAALDSSKVVTKEDLLSFNVAQDEKVYATLIRYLYTQNIVDGLQFINDMPTGFSATAVSMLIELTKVALGSPSYLVSMDTASYLQNLVSSYGKEKLLSFVGDIAIARQPSKNYVSGLFIKMCCNISQPPVVKDKESVYMEDLRTMADTIEVTEVKTGDTPRAMSLEALMEGADTIVG